MHIYERSTNYSLPRSGVSWLTNGGNLLREPVASSGLLSVVAVGFSAGLGPFTRLMFTILLKQTPQHSRRASLKSTPILMVD